MKNKDPDFYLIYFFYIEKKKKKCFSRLEKQKKTFLVQFHLFVCFLIERQRDRKKREKKRERKDERSEILKGEENTHTYIL